ncbi:uncharacterized protein LOC128547602 [Mercenaria mercenaria]|uniref:uncharacterized protein LOC128547602 n=1 Tax=Mercenaria mercenaria TaxID=6596 RepID=UPI00234F8B1E|nr:uncharacterized protein LOC128547602 [Mercenaria mercenaria]
MSGVVSKAAEAIHTTRKYKIGKTDWDRYHDFAIRHFHYNTEGKTVDENHTQFINDIYSISKKSIPMVKGKNSRKKVIPWWTEDCANAVKQRENARKNYSRNNKNDENLQKYRSLRNKAVEIIKKAKRTSLEKYITQINHKTTSKEVWDVVNKFRGKSSSSIGTLLNDNDPVVMEKDKANFLVQHYKKISSNDNYSAEFLANKQHKEQEYDLYNENNTAPHDDIEYNKPFSLLELKMALDQCIKGRMFTWIANFLEGRKIKVKVNGQLSDTVEPDNGTPQGSVISPLIFNLIMNTLNTAIDAHNKQSPPGDWTELAQFVDDGATWVTSPNPHSTLLKGQKVLEVIEKWSNEWGFTINPNKTQVLMVCRQPYLSPSKIE